MCSPKRSETTVSQGGAHFVCVSASPVPLNLATVSAVTRQTGVDKDLLSRNFPLSSDSSIHLTELCPEL